MDRYEVRLAGARIASYATEPEALEHARRLLAEDANAEPEIVDRETGRGAEPGASQADRAGLAQRIGF